MILSDCRPVAAALVVCGLLGVPPVLLAAAQALTRPAAAGASIECDPHPVRCITQHICCIAHGQRKSEVLP